LIPEKKPRKESINQEKKDEKEDNKSDNSINSTPSAQVEKSESENKQPKREKTSKMKKMDLDRKSHLSNIEGVIFEDVNEYAENEEESDLSVKRHLTDLGLDKNENRRDTRESIERVIRDSEGKNLKLEKSEIKKDSKQEEVKINKSTSVSSHSELKRSHSDVNPPHGNFSDYLRNLRQSQFEAEKKEENKAQPDKSNLSSSINTNYFKNESEPEINFKQKEKIELTDKMPLGEEITESQPFYEEPTKIPQKQKTQIQPNTFRELTNDEMEFYDIFKSLKLHKAKTQEEVMKEILDDKFQELSSKKKERENIIEEMLTKLFSKELAKSEEGKQIINNSQINSQEQVTNAQTATNNAENFEKQKIQDMVNLLKGKDKIESLMKQKNNALKYITSKAYKEMKKRDLRWINFFMVCLVLLTFGIYYYSRNYM
jgi:hypothetical protein